MSGRCLLEHADDMWDFGWLDDVMDDIHAGGIRVALATATVAPPPWLAITHPEIRPVTADGVVLGQLPNWYRRMGSTAKALACRGTTAAVPAVSHMDTSAQ